MPVASSPDNEPDWSSIRAAAVALGSVNEAAKRAAIHFPQDQQQSIIERIRKRAYREGWLEKHREIMSQPMTTRSNGTLSQKRESHPVPSGAEILENTLKEDERETKISLSRSARKLAKDAEDAPLESAGDILSVAKIASTVHGWATATNLTQINIGLMGS